MGAVLLSAGTAGKRYALPNSRVMIHQPLGGMRGQASDMEIQAKEILKMKDLLTNMLAKHSGQDPAKVMADSDRDYFMDAAEAKATGWLTTWSKNTQRLSRTTRKPRNNQIGDLEVPHRGPCLVPIHHKNARNSGNRAMLWLSSNRGVRKCRLWFSDNPSMPIL